MNERDFERRLDILRLFEEAQEKASETAAVIQWTAWDQAAFRSGYSVIQKSVKQKNYASWRFERDRGTRPIAPNRLDLITVQRIHALAADGETLREIARRLGINRETVRAYVGPRDRRAGMRRYHKRRKDEGRPVFPPWYQSKKPTRNDSKEDSVDLSVSRHLPAEVYNTALKHRTAGNQVDTWTYNGKVFVGIGGCTEEEFGSLVRAGWKNYSHNKYVVWKWKK